MLYQSVSGRDLFEPWIQKVKDGSLYDSFKYINMKYFRMGSPWSLCEKYDMNKALTVKRSLFYQKYPGMKWQWSFVTMNIACRVFEDGLYISCSKCEVVSRLGLLSMDGADNKRRRGNIGAPWRADPVVAGRRPPTVSPLLARN